ncbi:Nose resistant to fluoxetine protein 6 [Acropora cervicornis]|uniref:Nose resistant to fluoxetine protein 6 n=1 Tax=Acropora cervicornis TaxID=6130 RepID=A0AAD9PS72_ACRCE|nr:Nose resistant to fluoxetine protein 6 [Acropora cervicornis]
MWLGSYVVCQNISDAQYCLASKLDLEVTAKKSAPLTWGLCAPLACNATEIRQFITTISKENIHAESYPPPQEKTALLGAEANGESTPLLRSNVSASHSVSAPNIRFTQPNRKLEGFLVQFLLCFSITRNTSKVMDCTVPPGAITSVNGVRVLSMWFTFDTVSSAFFSVDSFFVLRLTPSYMFTILFYSNLYAFLGEGPMWFRNQNSTLCEKYWWTNLLLTPSYMFTILFYSNLYAFLGEGPMWFRNQNSTLCEKYWWTNLLYINNFYPTSLDDECLDWSWYLANDMQFYIISPLILFLWKGLLVSVGGLLGISFIVTAVNRIPRQIVCLVGWFVATALGVTVVYGIYTTTKEGGKPFNKAENIAYGTFSRSREQVLIRVLLDSTEPFNLQRIFTTPFGSGNLLWLIPTHNRIH